MVRSPNEYLNNDKNFDTFFIHRKSSLKIPKMFPKLCCFQKKEKMFIVDNIAFAMIFGTLPNFVIFLFM
jgi:hypothetical protein